MEKKYDKALERVTKALKEGNCGTAIHEMAVYLTAWPEQHTQEKLNKLQEDYQQMAQHWQTGEEDLQREVFYRQLLQRVFVLYANVLHYHRMKTAPYLYSLYTRVRQNRKDWSLGAIRQEMEGFVSDVAMLQLEPENTRKTKSEMLYRTHQHRMNELFEYVLTSRQWTDSVGQQFAEMMTAPTLDSNDQQLFVSAVTLSLVDQFDMAKFRMLTDVYRQSSDDAVRQRALIGWVLSLNADVSKIYPEQRAIVQDLLQSEDVCKELTELQIQLMYCQEEMKDTTTIQKEIMPDLLKGSNLKLSRLGLEEQEEDELENILHPEKEDERMEKLEATYQRMMNMQKQGSDIYYGGFSQMKRYPFFYDISNWFVPFFTQHPDIQKQMAVVDGKGDRFLQKIMSNNLFCNSDKYSFVLAFEQVVNQLPESIRLMMKRGEAPLDELGMDEEEKVTPTFLRRLALMDMYRFFRLFPHREEMTDPFRIMNPIWSFFSSPLLTGTPLDAHKREVVRLLKKHGYNYSAYEIVNTFPEEMRDVEYYMWKENYDKAYEMEPNNEKVVACYARQIFELGFYKHAAQLYDELLALLPGNSRYMLNKAVCLVNMEEYDEALKLLYQLNYEQPDNLYACRALAWALTCQGKTEQAERYYRQLMEEDQLTAEDYHNYGCNLWLDKHIDQAAEMFRKYAETKKNDDKPFFADDAEWLSKRGIGDVEVCLMEALLLT